MKKSDPRFLDSQQFTRRSADDAKQREVETWEDWVFDGTEYSHVYDRAVSLYVVYGEATMIFDTGEVVDLLPGDAMTINVGAKAIWKIKGPIRNRYIYH